MKKELIKIWIDTLKKGDKYSRTSLTWLISFTIANSMAIYDMIKNGFNMPIFMVYIGFALSMKVTDKTTKQD